MIAAFRRRKLVNLEEAAAKIERLTDVLVKIERWSHSYPIEVFPEPDLEDRFQFGQESGSAARVERATILSTL